VDEIWKSNMIKPILIVVVMVKLAVSLNNRKNLCGINYCVCVPQVYKSTICNDVMQHNYCPRGMFCAFAHSEGKLLVLS